MAIVKLAAKTLGIGLFGATCIIMLISLPVVLAEDLEYSIDHTELLMYRDGLVHVTQTLSVNQTFPSVTLKLVSSSVENLIVVDENQTLLDYEVEGSNLTIFTLGAVKAVVEYDTVMLTRKDAEVWTLTLEVPINVTVKLPVDATIIYLNSVPTAISTEDNRTVLQLSPSYWEISYILPTVPIEPTSTPPPTPAPTPTFTPTPILTPTPTPTTPQGKIQFPPEYLIGIVVLAVVAIGTFLLLKRKGPPRVEKIFREHPELRAEDREVIRFIAQRGGKVFEAEIRDRFPELPRTSVWRMVKRLERMNIVTVKKIGLQNQIELKN